ncbi:MAG: hypothetical protein MI863_14660 [Desulfobacterales bacterium]|nr:hypothetical protein [Desulfobacterales bacterium]
MKSFIRKTGRKAAGLTIYLCIFIFAGCIGAGWSGLRHNQDLMVSYKEGTLPDNLNYYYCGRSSIPYAVIGIDRAYTFKGKTWFKIESREDLYYKIRNLSDLEPGHIVAYGKDIVGPEGQKVGIWFSYYSGTGVRVDEGNKIVEVFNPYKPGSRSMFRDD